MFRLLEEFQSSQGQIKCSTARANARFESRTTGLAIKYVGEGREDYLVNGKAIALEAGQFMILQPGELYQAFTGPKSQPNSGICVDLNPLTIGNNLFDLFKYELIFGVPLEANQFLSLGPQLAGLSPEKRDNRLTRVGESLLDQIQKELNPIVELLPNIQLGLQAHAKKVSTQRAILAKLILAKNIVHGNYWKKLSLHSLSKQTAISPFQLNRLFKACFGQTPQALQVELRIQQAILLLQKDQYSLSEIANQLGYSDLAAFSKQFKSYCGRPPSRYVVELLAH